MRWPYYILTGSYCSLIVWLSSQSDPPGPSALFPQFDKLEHIGAFGLLCAMILIGMKRSGRPHSLRMLLLVPVLFTVAFGFTDEFHQGFVPKRNVDPFDIVADSIGAALAAFVLLHFLFQVPVMQLRNALFSPRNGVPADAE